MSEKFLLKDRLFNREKVDKIASEIKSVEPGFDSSAFVHGAVGQFPVLELKQRITCLSNLLRRHLPSDFRSAVTILVKALPSPCDPSLSDNDFGDFIYAPYAQFVAQYGCDSENLYFSLDALKEITTRFSAEDAIRYFINAFPAETLNRLEEWALDPHYHVRRLVSEGTRPKLPWAQKIRLHPKQTIPILDGLFSDSTRFVTRSVANHLNDISKINPDLVIQTLNRWKTSNRQSAKEMDYIVRHSLRTLIKTGHPQAISFFNVNTAPQVIMTSFSIINNPVIIGGSLDFECTIQASSDERLIIDYILYFRNKMGQLSGRKVYKLKVIEVKKDTYTHLKKHHKLRSEMTTRKLFSGEHRIDLQINGKTFGSLAFDLISR